MRDGTSKAVYGRYSAYKNSGIDWMGAVPAHWERVRLRSTTAGCQNGVWGDEPDGERDVPCVRVVDFDRVAFRAVLTNPTLRSVDPRVIEARELRKGDLLLEKSGGGENQPVGAVVLFENDFTAVCSNFVARMPVAPGFSARFLVYLHAAMYAARINVRSIKQNTGIQNLDSEGYLNEAVALPGFLEQQAVAAFLDRETEEIDALVAKKEQLIELLQEKRTALITRAVTKGLDPNVPMKDSGVEWLGDVPQHWATTKMWDVSEATSGATPPKEEREFWDGGIPWVSAKDMKRRFIDSSEDTVSDAALLAGLKLISPPAILVVVRGMILAHTLPVAINTVPVTINQDMKALRLDERLIPQFFAYWLEGVGRDVLAVLVDEAAHGTKAIRMDRWRLLSVQIPPIAEQNAIVSFIDDETARLDELVMRVQEGIDRLRELRTALISAAVTGKIDVRGEVAQVS